MSVAVVSRLVKSASSSMSAGLSPVRLLRIPPGCSARSPPAVAGAEVLSLSPFSASTMARRAVIKSSWLPLVLVAVAACRAARSAAIVAAGPPVRVLGFMAVGGGPSA